MTDRELFDAALAAAGSQRALARALGANDRTVRFWVAGRLPARGFLASHLAGMQVLAYGERRRGARRIERRASHSTQG